MKYEIVHGISLPKIGFGTWRIGGESTANKSLDHRSISALKSALSLGYTHFDTAEMYARGHAEDLLGLVIAETAIDREKLFITSKVLPGHLDYDDVLRSCDGSLHRLGTDYLDLYLIHWPRAGMKLAEAFRALNKLAKDGKVRHLGVSNFDLKLLKQSQKLCEMPIFTNQVPYSISDRTYVKNGVFDYCRSNGIVITAYSPLGEGRLKAIKALASIAHSHQATIPQIALGWLVSQPGVITIPMSFDPIHQKENLLAADIALTKNDLEQLS